MGEPLAGTGAARDSLGAGRLFARDGRDVARGLSFAFAPDLSRLSPAVVLKRADRPGRCSALGVSVGIMMAYRGVHAGR